MLQAPCPRCGEPSGDGLCGRCAAYLLRFDPFIARPGLPGPPVDREVRRGAALLMMNPDAAMRTANPWARPPDENYFLQFLNHLGLPDGGKAVLTRGDREVLHRLLRTWARTPPKTKDGKGKLLALYAEASRLPSLPAPIVDEFRSLAQIEGPPPEPDDEEIPPPTPQPAPEPEPEPAPEPEPEPEPEETPPVVPAVPALSPPPPPEDSPSVPAPVPAVDSEERRVLEELRADVAAKKDELSRWISDRHAEMDRREGLVQSQTDELGRREGAIAEKERAVHEEERRVEERANAIQRQAAEARAGEAKRSLFFLLFSMQGLSRETAKVVADTFGAEDRLREATIEQLAAVPGVPPEQAALIRDAFETGAGPPRRDLREKAEQMLEEGDVAAALEVFDELVRLAPEDVEAWMNRGEVLTLLGRIDDAIAAYERVLAIEPDHRAARSELANLFFETGDFGLAAATLQDLLKGSPDQVTLWLARASALLGLGKATEATLIYNAVLEGNPANLAASLALADLLLAMGDAGAADREYSRALQHHPQAPEALLKKGLLLNRQGRWGAAIQLFNRAISLRWDHREAWAAKGQVLLTQGKPKEALECFEKLLSFDDGQDDAWLGKAEAHLSLGENDRAAEAAGRALSLNKGNQDVHELLERLRDATDRPRESIEVSDLPPAQTFDHGVMIEMGDALLESGDVEAALRAYNEVLAKSPDDAAAWFGKGRALHALERYGEAVRCFTSAVDRAPENEEYRRWLAMCEERWKKEGS